MDVAIFLLEEKCMQRKNTKYLLQIKLNFRNIIFISFTFWIWRIPKIDSVTHSLCTTKLTGGRLNWASGFPASVYYLANFNFYNNIEFNLFFPSSRLYNYTV